MTFDLSMHLHSFMLEKAVKKDQRHATVGSAAEVNGANKTAILNLPKEENRDEMRCEKHLGI